MLKDLTSIYTFCSKYEYHFTIRNATDRPIEDPQIFRSYSVDNLINVESFKCNKYYIEYSKIMNIINETNTYDFFKDKVENRLWNNPNFLNINDVINSIQNTDKDYVIIGGSFWYYTSLYDMSKMSDIFKILIPSDKIKQELNINCINEKYNCIHYRYESDWIPNLKRDNIPYIIPPIDELIYNLPFKNKYPIYICTSNIEEFYSKKLLYNELETYNNILYKKKNTLNYDENGFLDLLIVNNCEEFYGNSISGFTILSSTIKQMSNFYNQIEYFYKYNIL